MYGRARTRKLKCNSAASDAWGTCLIEDWSFRVRLGVACGALFESVRYIHTQDVAQSKKQI
jgi:hypothetical protein